jgi:manganese/zinc/iron transport system permease protein
MSGADLEILAIAVVTAVAAALPGAFLVLRRMALVSDAISHSVLPGIVVAFFLTGSLSSPLLLVAAAATGVLTVALIEAVRRSRLVPEDAAIGLVFPALFSIGVILISRYAGDVHLDTDAVLLGELAFAPFDRLMVGSLDLGPVSLWTMGTVLVLNLVFIIALEKELALATIDEGLAALLGFSPAIIHYALMTMVSITTVGAFDAVGSILVVALMIAPPAAAYLICDRLVPMLATSAVFAAVSAVLGYLGARVLDVSIAGSMATAAGLVFSGTLVFGPGQGVVAQLRRRARQRLDFAVRMMLVHLLNHEGGPDADEECNARGVHKHLQWPQSFTRQVIRSAIGRGWVEIVGEHLSLTDAGRELGQRAVVGEL